MKTLFSYLNLPKLPNHLKDMVIESKNIVYDEQYNAVNEREVYGTKIGRVPEPVRQWVQENILDKFNSSNSNPHKDKILIHRHHYIEFDGISWNYKYNNAKGIIPKHRDYGRHYAINYVIELGGDNVQTKWWDNDFNEILSVQVEPEQWCILSVKELHGVTGIELNKDRLIIGLNYDPVNIENFTIEQDLAQYI